MTAGTNSSRDSSMSSAVPSGSFAGRGVAGGLPIGFGVPLAVAVLAGLLRAFAPLLPIVETAPELGPGFASVPLLLVLGLLPVAVAAVFAMRGNGATAAGLTAAVAGFAPGQALVDLQLVRDLSTAARPDLVLPTTLTAVAPAPGTWVLLGGHALTMLAGLLALQWYRRRGDAASWAGLDGRAPGLGEPALAVPGGHRGAGNTVENPGSVPGGGRVALALSIGLLGALGLLLSEPFDSESAFLLSRSVLEQTGPAFFGGLWLVIAAPVACWLAAAASEPGVRRGGLLGVALALLLVALPQLVSGLAVAELRPTWGPMLVLVVAGLLGWLAVPFGRLRDSTDRPRSAAAGYQPVRIAARGGTSGEQRNARVGDDAMVRTQPPPQVVLPAPDRLHAAAGALGLLAGGALLLAGLGSQVVLPPELPRLASYSDRLLLPSGVLIAVLGMLLLAGRSGAASFGALAGAVRPTYLIAVVLAPLAAAQALDGVLAATEIEGVRIAAGPWLCLCGVLAAAVGAGCAVAAGALERDEVDLTERRADPVLRLAAIAAVLLVIGALLMPTFTGAAFAAPSLSAELSIGWWGLALTLLVLFGGIATAPFSRPSRAAALLLGVVLVLAVHLLELPLTSARVRDFAPGSGLWLGLAALLVLLLMAGYASRAALRTSATPGVPAR